MHRFRWKRRRLAAFALPALVAIAGTTSVTGAAVTAGVAPTATTAGASKVKFHLGKHHVHAGRGIALGGVVSPEGRRTVVIRVNGARVQKVRTAANGRFRTNWRAKGPGVYRITAVAVRKGTRPVRSTTGRLNAYREVQASYYGPGLYGNGTACGGRLTPGTQGVAHKTLPCGSKVTLRKGNKTVTVRVIDRGPYVGNRVYDLTAATKSKLGFGSTGTVLATK